MVWLVVLLGVAVIALAVVVALTTRRLRAESELRKAADVRADERVEELRVATEALEQARLQRTAAEEETRTAAAGRAAAEETARAAEERATAAIADATAARSESEAALAEAERAVLARDEARAEADRAQIERDEARAAANRAVARADGADGHSAGATPTPDQRDETPAGEGLDAGLLWDLERARSERTWRQSVALSPDEESVFDRTEDQLIEAIRIDLEAAREEVGVVVDLDAELTAPLSAAGSLLTLRAAQELLASVVRHSESSVMRLRIEGDDVLVTIDAVDEQGERVVPPSLGDSPTVSPVDGGVRVRSAVQR